MQREAIELLKALRSSYLTSQQRKTIRGQILAGDIKGAQKGFKRLREAHLKKANNR